MVVVSEVGEAINQSVILIATLTLLIGLRRRSQDCCRFLFRSYLSHRLEISVQQVLEIYRETVADVLTSNNQLITTDEFNARE